MLKQSLGLLPTIGVAVLLATAPISAGETPSPAGAKVYFVNLKDGATVSSPLTIVFGLSGMGSHRQALKRPARVITTCSSTVDHSGKALRAKTNSTRIFRRTTNISISAKDKRNRYHTIAR